MKKLCIILFVLCLVLAYTSYSLYKMNSSTSDPPESEKDPPSSSNGGEEGNSSTDIIGDNIIYCDEISGKAGQEISVPVKIKNNSGLCGFELVVTYDVNLLTPKNVTASSALSNGSFNDSIETSQNNSFAVVWSGRENIVTDVELFVIKFNVAAEATGTITIKLSYNQENTINEDIEEIVLKCTDITIELQSED